MTYDVAFALVWATGDEVLNVNEAHAYASCSNCVTVAVAFQVVLIMDDAHVVVPQNLAVAANYECYRCITAAIASQLVLSLEEVPGTEQLLALGAVWNQLTEFGQSITSYPLSEVSAQLEEFKAEIVAILGGAPPVSTDTTSTPTSSSPTGTSTYGSNEPSPTSEPTIIPDEPAGHERADDQRADVGADHGDHDPHTVARTDHRPRRALTVTNAVARGSVGERRVFRTDRRRPRSGIVAAVGRMLLARPTGRGRSRPGDPWGPG